MSRLADIYFPPGRKSIVTSLGPEHDHSPRPAAPFALISCENSRCRAEMIRMGGIECVTRKWYVARDRFSFTIAQPDGGSHLHEPHGKDWEVECSSPACNEYFMHPSSAGDASAKVETRPKTGVELDVIHREFEERVRLESEIEVEIRRQQRSSLFPAHMRS